MTAKKKDQYVLLIRPADERIERIDITGPLSLEQMYGWLNCSMIETMRIDRTNFLVFDEEATLRFAKGQNPDGHFYYRGDLAGIGIDGRGLIVGTDGEGEMIGTTHDQQDAAQRITFSQPPTLKGVSP